eukprot:758625-Hanusia_phi.AAC.5
MVNSFTIHDENEDGNVLSPSFSRRSSSRKALGQIDANVDRVKEAGGKETKKRNSSLGSSFAAPTPACTPFDAKKVNQARIEQDMFTSVLSEKFKECIVEEDKPSASYRLALVLSLVALLLGMAAFQMQAQGPALSQQAGVSESLSITSPLVEPELESPLPPSPQDEVPSSGTEAPAVEEALPQEAEQAPVEEEESMDEEEVHAWDEAILSGPMQITSSSSSEVVAAGFARLTEPGDLFLFDLPDSRWYSQVLKLDGCAYRRSNALWVDRSNCIPIYTQEEEMQSCFPEREEAGDWIATLSSIKC